MGGKLNKCEGDRDEIIVVIDKIKKFNKLKILKIKKTSQTFSCEKNLKISEKIISEEKKIKKLLPARVDLEKRKEKKIKQLSIIEEKIFQVADLTETTTIYTSELKFLNQYQKCVDKKKGISQKILSNLCLYI